MGSRMHETYVFEATRTPFAKYAGAASQHRPDDLLAGLMKATLQRSAIDAADINDVVIGNANGAGEENRNVARMSTLLAGFPVSVPGTTVNRLCGSSLEAVIQARRAIAVGDADLVLAGGVESMTRAPYVLPKSERPFPSGDATLASTTLGWRLTNPAMPATWTTSLGAANEGLATRFGVTRTEQDEFASRSHQLAAAAWRSGNYSSLVITPTGLELARDEPIRDNTSAEGLAALKPAFATDGTITAGNASPLSDGAAVVLLGSQSAADKYGLATDIRVVASAAIGNTPEDFGIAPVEAALAALARAGIRLDQLGAVELNEAFAVQSLLCIRAWNIDPEIVNAWGGAIAIGHPLGASGARLVGTLAARMRVGKHRWGLAALCIGVGQALAVVLENTGVAE